MVRNEVLNMKEFIKKYKSLMDKYILLKLTTVLVIVMLISKLLNIINNLI